MTLGPRVSVVLATNPLKATCFNYSEPRHFASSCLNPRTTPQINKIEQDDASSNEALDEADNTDSKSEN